MNTATLILAALFAASVRIGGVTVNPIPAPVLPHPTANAPEVNIAITIPDGGGSVIYCSSPSMSNWGAVEWGDGSRDSWTASAPLTHEYAVGGEYTNKFYTTRSVAFAGQSASVPWVRVTDANGTMVADGVREIRTTDDMPVTFGAYVAAATSNLTLRVGKVTATPVSTAFSSVSQISLSVAERGFAAGALSRYGAERVEVVRWDFPGFTSVGGQEFDYATSLVSIDLSDCTTIAGHAFRGCSRLLSVDLSACTSLGSSAFSGCSSLASVGDLSACTSIGWYTFYGCSSLESVGDMPNAILTPHPGEWDGAGQFMYCTNLVSIGSIDSVTYLPERCFHGCYILGRDDPQGMMEKFAGVEVLGKMSLMDCRCLPQDLYFPNVKTNALSFGENALHSVKHVRSVIMPNCEVNTGAFGHWDEGADVAITNIVLGKVSKFGNYFATRLLYLQHLKVGTLDSDAFDTDTPSWDVALAQIGKRAPLQSDGKTRIVIEVGNTMADLVSITNFPGCANFDEYNRGDYVKWKCADGTVTYNKDTGEWEQNAE